MFSTSELIDLGAIKQWDSFLTEAIGKGLKGRQLRNAIPHRRMTATIYKNYPQGEMTITDFPVGAILSLWRFPECAGMEYGK